MIRLCIPHAFFCVGYGVFNCEPFGKNQFECKGGIGIIRMLFNSSLICLVGGGAAPAFSPRKVRLLNTQKNSLICELTFATAVVDVLLNKKRLVVLLLDKVHIYDLETLTSIQTLELYTSSSPSNPTSTQADLENHVACAMTSTHTPQCFLALPATNLIGDVLIYDAMNLTSCKVIHAHKERLQQIAFSKTVINLNKESKVSKGHLMATASKAGTLIRVFVVPSGEKLYVFRRGSLSARILSIAFDETNGSLVSFLLVLL